MCRNLLIYLDREVQRDIFCNCCVAPRWLSVSRIFSISRRLPEAVAPLDKRNRIFRVRAGSSAVRRPPTTCREVGYARTPRS
nr:hypothetical protein [Pseudomonas fluorescens]